MASRAAFSAGRRYFASGPSPALVKVCRKKIIFLKILFFFGVNLCVLCLRKPFQDFALDDGPDSLFRIFSNRIESVTYS